MSAGQDDSGLPVEPPAAGPRRRGDAIAIPGSYQHQALTRGPRVQRYWHHAKLELLDWLFPVGPGERVLDVGAGSGVFADRMASRGAQVTAIDANPDAVAYARRTFTRPGLDFRQGLLDELQFAAESFDKATCLEVVEHVFLAQDQVLFRDLFGLLKPGGALLVTTPNFRGTWPLIEWIMDRVGRAARMDADQHVTHFDRGLLTRLLAGAGFEVRTMRTVSTFAPFVAALSWSAAAAADRLERRVDLPFGNILAAVAIKASR